MLNLMLFAIALWVVNRVLAEYRYDEIAGAVAAVPAATLGLTLVVSAAAYLALVGYDYLAFRFVGRPLPLRSTLVPSFVAWAVSNTAPASVLAAGGLRYRLYASLGLTPAEAAVVAAFNVVTYLVGLLALVGLVLLVQPSIGLLAGWPTLVGRAIGLTLVLAVAGYLLATRLRTEPVRLFRCASAVEFPRPVSLLEEPLTGGWRLAIAAVLVLTLWLGLFVYRHERYSGELWWRFALAGDAPRFLRAAVGMSIVVLLFALARLLGRRAPPAPGSSQPPEIIPAADRRTTPP